MVVILGMKQIKWENIKIGQDYCTEKHIDRKLTKIGDMRIRKYHSDGSSFDHDIDIISNINHYLWQDKIKLKDCPHCELLKRVFPEDMNNREYWIMTEIFVYLHNGKDYCDGCDN